MLVEPIGLLRAVDFPVRSRSFASAATLSRQIIYCPLKRDKVKLQPVGMFIPYWLLVEPIGLLRVVQMKRRVYYGIKHHHVSSARLATANCADEYFRQGNEYRRGNCYSND
ncbi:hypothetical protein [Solibacillus silvestris]|uniref:hypothetical protein n=1 Tax=Solibacillus silvestris TaxID=76853 RepID=UPI001E652C67|nr:hypothetical protein [Solibacillus silvestris]